VTDLDTIKAIQGLLGVTQDGIFGPKSQAAMVKVIAGAGMPVESSYAVHSVIASSFADPADVTAFKRCKDKGGSDHDCFRVGDNAVGLWGDSTEEGTGPSCALPPDDWHPFYNTARLKKVLVKANENEVVCELKDTMPPKTYITNGAGIDLNPDAVRALGLEPPIMESATWQWA
jgi:hypothetical protein